VDNINVAYRENFILSVLKKVYDMELDTENNETNLSLKVRKLSYL
jgi:hypothetical protein